MTDQHHQPDQCLLLPPELDRSGWLRRAQTLADMIADDADMLRTVDHRLAYRLMGVGLRDHDAVTAWLGYQDFQAADRRFEIRRERGIRQKPSRPRPQIAAWGRAMALSGARSAPSEHRDDHAGDRGLESLCVDLEDGEVW